MPRDETNATQCAASAAEPVLGTAAKVHFTSSMRSAPRLIARFALAFFAVDAFAAEPARAQRTVVSIVGEKFVINGQPTYAGRTWNGVSIEGRLMNSRMVQGIYDDQNAETVSRWKYPDTGKWDSERNTREFIAAMPEWRRHGLLGFTINLQGGSPQGYSKAQPWHNSAFTDDGELRPAYMARLEKILDRADELGMAPIVGFFYFGQIAHFKDEAAIVRATVSLICGNEIRRLQNASTATSFAAFNTAGSVPPIEPACRAKVKAGNRS